jgi:hypothetical protein
MGVEAGEMLFEFNVVVDGSSAKVRKQNFTRTNNPYKYIVPHRSFSSESDGNGG